MLFDALDKARAARRSRIAFDTNFRTRGWPDRDVAPAGIPKDILSRSDIALASTEDLDLLFGERWNGDVSWRDKGLSRGGAEARRARPAASWSMGSDELVEAKTGRKRS